MKNPLQFSHQCSPFSRFPKAWHQIQVGKDNGVKVYDDTTQKFTGLHSLSANDLKAILAKATALRVDEGYRKLAIKILPSDDAFWGLATSDDELTWRCAPGN